MPSNRSDERRKTESSTRAEIAWFRFFVQLRRMAEALDEKEQQANKEAAQDG
jgi:hypothetical protein